MHSGMRYETYGGISKMLDDKLWDKSKSLVLNGTSLFSRGPRISPDNAPKYIDDAKDCYFKSLDHKSFLDYGMAVGSVLLGYGTLSEELMPHFKKGGNWSLLSPYQVKVAEKLHKNIPSCGKLKFLSTGSEATESAVRVARAFTGKQIVIHDHYHGWISWCAPKKHGIPRAYSNLSIQQEESDIEKYKTMLDAMSEVACVIVEPVKADETSYHNRIKFLNELKTICHKHDALLIFDEVACGFRFGLGGAQKLLGVTPDVSAFAKSTANGYPLSFFCCNKQIADDIEDKIFVSSTFGGSSLPLVACDKTIDYINNNDVIESIQNYAAILKTSINSICWENELLDHISIVGCPSRLDWKFSSWDVKTLVFQEFIKHGIFFGWEIKNSYTHDSDRDISKTLDAFNNIVKTCKGSILSGNTADKIEGTPMGAIL